MSQISSLIYEINNLKKIYNGQEVVNIRQLKFHRGTIYGIIGPIGCGKSTLLKMMAGCLKQTSGTIKYEDDFRIAEMLIKSKIEGEKKINYYSV